jgi:hypothetical protein
MQRKDERIRQKFNIFSLKKQANLGTKNMGTLPKVQGLQNGELK